MAMARSMLKNFLEFGASPAEALDQVNIELCSKNPEGLFVTAFVFLLDMETGLVTFSNGGHNPPLLLRKEGTDFLRTDAGILLGLFEEGGFEDHTVQLDPSETLLLYTDGITEAVNSDKMLFGEERLEDLHKGKERDAQAAVKRTIGAVEDFSRGCEQFDDMTLLAVTWTGLSAASGKRGEDNGEK